MEDSISCSPGNDRKQSRSRKFHKKTTRKSQRLSGLPTSASKSHADLSFIECLYEEIPHPKSQCNYFNPFESGQILAAADQAQVSASTPKRRLFASQGFVKLENLPIRQDEGHLFAEPYASVLNSKDEQALGPETQFGISESELVRFCDEAELESPHTNDTKTPHATRSIVDSILEDFCGSPYSESPPKVISDDSTPVFRFKSQSLRTYIDIRHRKPRRNIVTELTHVSAPADDGNMSDSSGLSVQEDLSQNIIPQLDTVDLNNSIRVCENLLNLSSFFSQEISHAKSSPMIEENESFQHSAPAILNEIMEIKRRPFIVSRSKSPDEFYGFPNSDSGTEEDALKELLEDEDDVLQQINCDSLCYDKAVPTVSFANNCNDMDSVLDNANAGLEELNRYLLPPRDLHTNWNELFSESQYNCNSHKAQRQDSSRSSPQEDEQLFDDLWDDNDCLLNYKTQKLPSISKQERRKSIDCDYQMIECNRKSRVSSNVHACRASTTIDGPSTSRDFRQPNCTLFVDFSKASRNSTAISDEAKETTTEMKAIFEATEIKQRMDEDIGVPTAAEEGGRTVQKLQPCEAYLGSDRLPAHAFVQFSTASKKPIAISNEAKRMADAILKKFELEEQEKRVDIDSENMTTSSGIKMCADVLGGFSTASKKPIAISNKARQRADEILKKFEQEEREKRVNIDSEDVKSSAIKEAADAFGGFSTASKNFTAISNEANHRVDAILEKFKFVERKLITEVIDASSEELDPSTALSIPSPIANAIMKQSKKQVESNQSIPAFVGFSTAARKPIAISVEAKRKADAILDKFEKAERDKCINDETDVTSPITDEKSSAAYVGFSTASLRPIVVSNEAKRRADEMLKQFEQVENEQKQRTTNEKPQKADEISKEVRQNAMELLMDIEFFEEAFEDELKTCKEPAIVETNNKTCVETNSVFEGFKTASEKAILVSEVAKQHADQILGQIEQDGLSQDFIECMEADLKNVCPNPSIGRFEQATTHTHDLKLMSDTKLSHMHVNESCSLGSNGLNSARKNAAIANQIGQNDQDDRTDERPSKRKRLQKSPAPGSIRRLSCNERTPLNRIENAVLYKMLSMPLLKSTSKSAFISRKNLLSLSKRKKSNSPKGVSDPENGPKTPEKLPHPSAHCELISTPNLKEFFDSVSTSTPRLFGRGECKVDSNHPKDSSIETDFRQINWDDSCNTVRVCKSSLNGDSDVTYSEISPSPKQRIERLKMYGEPPTLSPILMVNKCRPSGLRRGRSLMKP